MAFKELRLMSVWSRWLTLLAFSSCVALTQASSLDEGLRIMASRTQGNCMACHEIPVLRSTPSLTERLSLQGTIGPSLQGVGARYSREQLRQWIVDARVIRPGSMMPPYGTTQGLHEPARVQSLLSPAQVEVVVNTLVQWVDVATPSPRSAPETGLSRDSSVRQVQSAEGMSPVEFWIEQGQTIWRRDCASCHALNDVTREVARYPKLNAERKLINLEDQIVLCRLRTASKPTTTRITSLEDADTLSLSAFLHDRARQDPIDLMPPSSESDAIAWRQHLAAGEQLYTTRRGNMNLSCRQCHDDNVGATMRSFRVTSAYPVGFPVYRLSWQGMGSMDRRIRACFFGVQAQVPPAQDQRLRQLELYLKHRARGRVLEAPSVKP